MRTILLGLKKKKKQKQHSRAVEGLEKREGRMCRVAVMFSSGGSASSHITDYQLNGKDERCFGEREEAQSIGESMPRRWPVLERTR